MSYATSAGSATTAGTASAVAWSGITGKPSSFTPSSHNHDDSYVKLSGSSTVTGGITFNGQDTYGIFTNKDNFCVIGSESSAFYRSYVNNMYVKNIYSKATSSEKSMYGSFGDIGSTVSYFDRLFIHSINMVSPYRGYTYSVGAGAQLHQIRVEIGKYVDIEIPMTSYNEPTNRLMFLSWRIPGRRGASQLTQIYFVGIVDVQVISDPFSNVYIAASGVRLAQSNNYGYGSCLVYESLTGTVSSDKFIGTTFKIRLTPCRGMSLTSYVFEKTSTSLVYDSDEITWFIADL